MSESGAAPDAGAADGDRMTCRNCGQEQRASEGYPCAGCGTFLCVVCEMRGVTYCRTCAATLRPESVRPPT